MTHTQSLEAGGPGPDEQRAATSCKASLLKVPLALSKSPSCRLLGLTLARQHRALWGGCPQRPVQPLGYCRKSWRPALQCIASGG